MKYERGQTIEVKNKVTGNVYTGIIFAVTPVGIIIECATGEKFGFSLNSDFFIVRKTSPVQN